MGHPRPHMKMELVKRCYEYLLNNFGRFSQPNKIKVALAIVGKDIVEDGRANIERIVNIVNSYNLKQGDNNSPNASLSAQQVGDRSMELASTIQANLLASPSEEDNPSDKQADKGSLSDGETDVCVYRPDVHPSEVDSVERPKDAQVISAERTFEERTE